MATPRKAKAEDGGTRRRLLEATAQIMHDEGYAGATSRRVAAKAGVRQPLVHYYFPTMDDLFLAVLREGADEALDQMRAALPKHRLGDLPACRDLDAGRADRTQPVQRGCRGRHARPRRDAQLRRAADRRAHRVFRDRPAGLIRLSA